MDESNTASVVASDLPKFQEFLQNIQDSANNLTNDIEALVVKVKSGDLATSNGVSLLDVKNQTLLHYIQNLIAVGLCKVKGESIGGSDFVKQSVECRTVLEKIRPLEQKLKYQIDKVLRSFSDTEKVSENDHTQFKPNLDNFASSGSEDEEDLDNNTDKNETKKYIPPHIAAVKLDESGRKQSHMEKQHTQALSKSSIIAELVSEATDAPSELSHHSQVTSRVVKEREERKHFEEEYFTRINVTKKQRMAERHMLRKSEVDTLTSFGKLDILHGNTASSATSKKRKHKNFKKGGKSKKRKFTR